MGEKSKVTTVSRAEQNMFKLRAYAAAGYPLIWACCADLVQGERDLANALGARDWSVFVWDCIRGMRDLRNKTTREALIDPLAAVLTWSEDTGKRITSPAAGDAHVLLMHGLHRDLDGVPALVQAILVGLPLWIEDGAPVVALVPPGFKVPIELQRLSAIWEQGLPDRAALVEKLGATCTGNSAITVEDADAVVAAATGLTEFEAGSAYALSAATREDRIEPIEVMHEKARLLRDVAGLKLAEYPESFDVIGGLDNLKTYCTRAVRSGKGRGVLLLGHPGTGKSAFARALGRATGRATLEMDLAAMFGSLVGQTETQVRAALDATSAMAPVILFIDEIEKAMAGSSGSGAGDSGTTMRAFGIFLRWLSDHTEDVFVVATANDISGLRPELLRAERWDAVFFVDLPTAEEREIIYRIHARAYGIENGERGPLPDVTDWTGAELKTLVRTSIVQDCSLVEAAAFVVPIARARAEEIIALRTWAKSRTTPASKSAPAPKPQTEPTCTRRVRRVV